MPKRIYVFTESNSVHIIDPEGMTVKRLRAKALRDVPQGVISNELRRDEDTLVLWAMPDITLGARMDMFVQVRDDPVMTFRSTTFVTAVLEVTGEDEVLPPLSE